MPRFPRNGRIWSVQLNTDRPSRGWSFSQSQSDRGYDWCYPCRRLCTGSHRRRCSFSAFRLEVVVQHEVSILAHTGRNTDDFSIPFGLLAILTITNLWPHEEVAHFFSWKAFNSIDFLGSATLLTSSGFLVFAVQQAGSDTFAWGSPEIISALVISSLSWLVFVWWEVHLETRPLRSIEPIFPIRLMLRRVYSAGLL